MNVKFIGVFSAPGTHIGPPTKGPPGLSVMGTMAPGFDFDFQYSGQGTWAVDDRGTLWELCHSAAEWPSLVWVRHPMRFAE